MKNSLRRGSPCHLLRTQLVGSCKTMWSFAKSLWSPGCGPVWNRWVRGVLEEWSRGSDLRSSQRQVGRQGRTTVCGVAERGTWFFTCYSGKVGTGSLCAKLLDFLKCRTGFQTKLWLSMLNLFLLPKYILVFTERGKNLSIFYIWFLPSVSTRLTRTLRLAMRVQSHRKQALSRPTGYRWSTASF